MKSHFVLRSPYRDPVLHVLLLFAITASASAQTPTANTPSAPQSQTTPSPSPSPTPSAERQFLKNILRDQRAIWTSPLHLQKGDANWLAPLGLSTAALIVTDRRTAGALHDNRLRLNISRDISYLGSGFGAGTIAGSLYLIGRARGDARLRETGLLAAEALIDDSAVFPVIKVVTERTRPRKDLGRGRFFHGGFSFPSGHAMSVWSLAAVVGDEYKERPLVRFGVYGLAAVVSASRFTGRNHFLSDVLVGSAIGYGIGRYVYRTHHDSALGSTSQGIPRGPSKVLPLIIPRYERARRDYGVALVWTFR
jgi:membrane-associated phospholipid phosphatase